MAVIQEIPKPMDWRVVSIAGNNATEVVNLQFQTLRDMLAEAQSAADTVMNKFNSDIPDFGDIEFDSSFNPYEISTVMDRFDPDLNLEDILADLPARPTVNEPASPGTAPDVNFETREFTGELVFDDNLNPPDRTFEYSEEGYESPLDDSLTSVLLGILSNGGTSLGAAVEEALWQRARDRIADEYEQETIKTSERWAAAGWDIPSGAEDAAMREVSNKRMRALEQANYEIMIEQARLALQNFHHAIDAGNTLEGLKKDFFNKVKDRALQAAAETVRQSIALYSAVVEYNRLKMEKYRSEAEVFQIQQRMILERETAKLELYKTTVEVFVAQWNGEKTKIEAYAAQVQAEATRINALSERNKDELQKLGFQLDAHDRHQKNILGLEDAKARVQSANAEHEANLARISIAAQEGTVRNALERISMIRRQLELAAQLCMQRLASLLSAFNISASLSDSEATQESLSHSYAHQDSVSAAVSEDYRYSG